MRYPFTQRSHSFVNRCVDLILRSNPLSNNYEITDQESREAFDRDKGFFVKYGIKNVPLVTAMWTASDIATDYNGDTDQVHEIYPLLKAAWEATINFGATMSDDEKRAEDTYHDALKVATDFENDLYLAMCVANALEALENGIRNFWSTDGLLEASNREFKNDRARIEQEIIEILANAPEFSDLIYKQDA